ncbi:MAG: adenine deaminase [Saprospiraceae bacterium]|nr:adenine deaminase [Saprospiraceae bacterium]
MKTEFTIEGNFVDIRQRAIYPARLVVANGKIRSIRRLYASKTRYILPGFIDAHVHIESSMLVPTEFAKTAVLHGTVATVSDPHEIANVLGTEGVWYMIENGRKSPLKFNFGAPSCVPATNFETAGAEVTDEDIAHLLASPEVKYLAEMMNWPGVIFDDPSVQHKLDIARRAGKPIDGHAPGLMGKQATKYISKGITTDHECYMIDEARFKLKHGMKVIIREGSAARNFDTLAPLINKYYDRMMFCSDDKHPDDLIEGHINLLVRRAVARGADVFKVLQMACINPVEHYNLEVGTTQVGDWADLIVVDNLTDFNVIKTYINGDLVAERGRDYIKTEPERIVNNFTIGVKKASDFALPLTKPDVNVIEVLDRQLITKKFEGKINLSNGQAIPSVSDDILKIAVVNRYFDAPVATALIKGYGLKKGAIASSVAHDSHNIIVVGVSDEDMCQAVNAVIESKGGLSATDGNRTEVLPLPIAGLMSDQPTDIVAAKYTELVAMARDLGSTLTSPFMSLSFMALLVIPSLKLSDKGLFDGEKFEFCPIERSES